MKLFFSLLLGCFSVLTWADEIYPPQCQPLVVSEESLKLTAEKPQIVMVHNLSAEDLWITHPVTEASASAGWSSRLQSGNWSALVVGDAKFELSCIESRPGHEQQIFCAGVLAACEWSVQKQPKGPKGTFWAGEDMALPALIAHLGSRGYGLPTSSQ